MSWKLQGNQAVGTASTPQISDQLRMDLSHPEQGAAWTIEGVTETWGALSGNLFSDSPAPIDESYVRGGDLVVHHAESSTTKLTTTLYRRLLEQESVAGRFAWEMVIAVNTSTLGVQPQVCVTGHCGVAERQGSLLADSAADSATAISVESHPLTWLESAPLSRSSIVLRLADGTYRAVWIHPSDGRSTVRQEADGTWVETLLDLQCLEKGVIRSARIGFERFPATATAADFVGAFERFMEADLPLTT